MAASERHAALISLRSNGRVESSLMRQPNRQQRESHGADGQNKQSTARVGEPDGGGQKPQVRWPLARVRLWRGPKNSQTTTMNELEIATDKLSDCVISRTTDALELQPRASTANGSASNGGIGPEANAFFLYQLYLRAGPFKRAVCLFGLLALSLLLTLAPFAYLRYREFHSSAAVADDALAVWPLLGPPLASLVELGAVAHVARQVYLRFRLEKATPQRDHFGQTQLVLLASGALFAAALASQRPQLIAFQPIIMFISYTLLSVNNGRAFAAMLTANLIHLAALPFLLPDLPPPPPSSESIGEPSDDSPGDERGATIRLLVLVTVITYAVFHAIGLYLNKQSRADKRCRESYEVIKSFLWGRMNMDFEDKGLNRMLLSAFPEHLAREMRADIEMKMNSPRQLEDTGQFKRTYLARYENVSILFADIVNFTKLSEKMDAQNLVQILNRLFGNFDRAAQINKCLRIKILGDCYYTVCGIPDKIEDHAARAVEMGLDMIELLGHLPSSDANLNMRVGINSGNVLCGVFGNRRWQFDVYSDDVIRANAAEQSGQPGRVHITQATRRALAGRYELEPRGDKHPEHPDASFFVKASEIRRPKLVGAAAATARRCVANNCVVGQAASECGADTTADSSLLPLVLDEASSLSVVSEPLAAECDRATVRPAATTTMTSDATGAHEKGQPEAGQQQQQQQQHRQQQQRRQSGAARVRFKSAGKRLITMLYLIDPPFSNLARPTQVKTSRLLLQTILDQQCRPHVDPLWLRFESPQIGRLYDEARARPSAALWRRAQELAIFSLALVCLLLLCLVSSSPSFNFHSAQHHHQARQSHAGAQPATTLSPLRATTNETGVVAAPRPRELDAAALRLDTLESLTLIGEIMAAFLLSVLVYVHQAAYGRRRDFAWREKARMDEERAAVMRSCNRSIFFNLLPPHVANYFLEPKKAAAAAAADTSRDTRQHMAADHMISPPAHMSASTAPEPEPDLEPGTEAGAETGIGTVSVAANSLQPEAKLYYQSYERIGVVFANISNFSDFYCEDVREKLGGLECLRLLNEIISDFDSILDETKFKDVDKIKTIGATYMAAIGLSPGSELPSGPIDRQSGAIADGQDPKKMLEARAEVARCLQLLVEFVFEMKSKLADISASSFNSFILRAGINLGPVTAGVIGASKPQYDIWGNTVNVASRMESTAEPGRIQIDEEVYHILSDFNQESELKLKFTCRGKINVKGKGEMTTYYLDR